MPTGGDTLPTVGNALRKGTFTRTDPLTPPHNYWPASRTRKCLPSEAFVVNAGRKTIDDNPSRSPPHTPSPTEVEPQPRGPESSCSHRGRRIQAHVPKVEKAASIGEEIHRPCANGRHSPSGATAVGDGSPHDPRPRAFPRWETRHHTSARVVSQVTSGRTRLCFAGTKISLLLKENSNPPTTSDIRRSLPFTGMSSHERSGIHAGGSPRI